MAATASSRRLTKAGFNECRFFRASKALSYYLVLFVLAKRRAALPAPFPQRL
jgi:hypothetical protein